MSPTLKTVAMRLPGTLSSCPRAAAPFFTASTTTTRPVCLSQRYAFPATIQSPRHNSDLAKSSQKSVDAQQFKTASDLASKRATSSRDDLPPSNPASEKAPLDWDTFFKLRLRRRRVQVFFSALSSAGGIVFGAGVLSSGMADPIVNQVPLDPYITLGGMTVLFGCAGWLVGPSVGNQIFYLLNRSMKSQLIRKEDQFLARIRKNRVDPSNASANNPVPDFYGEKIQSVKGYRQWLKDQRAFNRKKTTNIV